MTIKGNRLGNVRIRELLREEESYAIYLTASSDRLLVVGGELYERWLSDGLFYSVDPMKRADEDGETLYFLVSGRRYQLAPVRTGTPLCRRADAVAFAYALKRMRELTDVSLFDGVYVEEYGYILPTYSGAQVSDDALLGTYLSGGRVRHISCDDLRSPLLSEAGIREAADIMGIERAVAEVPGGTMPETGGERRFRLPGRPELERFFNEHVIDVLENAERYERLGIGFPSSVLLYGPPGCGKTYAVDRLAEYLGLPRFDIDSSSVASPYIHDTSKKVSEVFERAKACAPSIVVIDEVEGYLSDRGSADSANYHVEEVGEFLRQIQDAHENRVLVIGMTNMYDRIDPAVLRRGRFDHHVEVGLPSVEEIRALLSSLVKDIPMADDVDLDALAGRLEGRTLADVSFVVKEAGLLSGRKRLDRIGKTELLAAADSLPEASGGDRIGF